LLRFPSNDPIVHTIALRELAGGLLHGSPPLGPLNMDGIIHRRPSSLLSLSTLRARSSSMRHCTVSCRYHGVLPPLLGTARTMSRVRFTRLRASTVRSLLPSSILTPRRSSRLRLRSRSTVRFCLSTRLFRCPPFHEVCL